MVEKLFLEKHSTEFFKLLHGSRLLVLVFPIRIIVEEDSWEFRGSKVLTDRSIDDGIHLFPGFT